ncbi:hypothetical protein [Microcoleus sp. N3A4]|uniref:hypothetical protein n=1 Tax=Microcoleus sp. N3A4 TaxID=3055379 RepID=UPI002FCF654A
MWKPVYQLNRGFEGLDRSLHSIAAQYRADGGKSLQTVFRHPNFNWTVGQYPRAQQVRPVRSGTGDGLPRTAESSIARPGAGDEHPTRDRARC